MKNNRILAIFAHPDDELGCVGTLANHSDRGDEIHLLFLSKGEGTTKINESSESIKKRRVNEGKKAGELIGAKVTFLDIPDTKIRSTREHADMVAYAIKKIRPDIIITWDKPIRTGTGHPDHRYTHDIVIDAITYARFGNKEENPPPHRERISLYTVQHHESKPTDLEYVDVTEQFDRIMNYVDIYADTFGDFDAKRHKETLIRYFGQYVRVDYAEAFKKLTWSKPHKYLS